eukprot:TRINITY_DN1517_c0_g1_i7.p1 TRINITY_DN1517_c0_g1~~TRINITY_DN1517_c0_g1_i7.p1  ORF type:complete len:174 (+),score=31.75 TRINITY_DN1517_c0_g1_i7:62-523(+)
MCIRDRYDVLGLNGFFDIGTPDWLGKQSSSLMPPLSKPYIKDKEQMEKHEKFINEIDETLHNHLLSFNVKGTDHPMRETSTIIDEHHYENEYHRMLDERRHTALIAARAQGLDISNESLQEKYEGERKRTLNSLNAKVKPIQSSFSCHVQTQI